VLLLQPTTDFARRDEMRQRLTEQERQERNQQLQKTLTLLVHACSCHDPQCSSTSCRKVRAEVEPFAPCQLWCGDQGSVSWRSTPWQHCLCILMASYVAAAQRVLQLRDGVHIVVRQHQAAFGVCHIAIASP